MRQNSQIDGVLALALLTLAVISNPAHTGQIDILGQPESVAFGEQVVVLQNGNIVVCDPARGPSNTGAVYVYGATGNLISTLVGSGPESAIGSGGITKLANGSFIVSSPDWDAPGAVNAGAVTLVNGEIGLNATVSASNSLVGSTLDDRVGASGDVSALANGHYLVRSSSWDNAAIVNAGAVTWGDGSLGVRGTISAQNSLVGTRTDDAVGDGGITLLSNGHFVVSSNTWDHGEVLDTGAVTWVNAATGLIGPITPANSLIGRAANDFLGSAGVHALRNGHYVISSSSIDTATAVNVGAVTWANGSTGLSGIFSAANSLLGTKAFDRVGEGIVALSNDHYVIQSPNWDFGALANVGAVTWANGNAPLSGEVSAANSLIGSSSNDRIGSSVTALSNGNFVVASPNWDNAGVADIGAVRWADGSAAPSGQITATEALTGSQAGDKVGLNGATALSNGNYVISSPFWKNAGIARAGAATWANGSALASGRVSVTNSLVGSSLDDQVGSAIALGNGHYVVRASSWNRGSMLDAGAIVWANGSTGISGEITLSNALLGAHANDSLGSNGVLALSNGNFVVSSPVWDSAAFADAGAATWGNGASGINGEVSSANSLLGAEATERVSSGGLHGFSDGSYAVASAHRANAGVLNAGAVSVSAINMPLLGAISAANSVLGSSANEGFALSIDYDASRVQVVVGRPISHRVSLYSLDTITEFANGFEGP
jgi:Repeat of unknown function (DUF5650)